MRHAPLSLAALALVAGCTVGPDYAGPPEVAPAALRASRFAHAPADAPGHYPAASWWTGFNDPVLNRLAAQALAASPSIEAARGKLAEARAQAGLARAQLRPAGGASANALHVRAGLGNVDGLNDTLARAAATAGVPAAGVSLPDHVETDLFTTGIDASWELDPAGGNRRQAQGAKAQAEAAAADLADAQVQLTAELARAYVGLRVAQAQLAISQRAVALQRETLGLTRQQARQGTTSALDVARLQTQLAGTEADLPLIEAQVAVLKGQVALICGAEPGALDAALAPVRAIPKPPKTVAVGSPAAMLRRRPDIRAAERDLAAANAGIGTAVAGYFPKVRLLGMLTTGGTSAGDVLRTDALSVIAGPSLQWNFLDFGRNGANVGRAQAKFDQAQAQYRGKVLAALQDAEGSLATFAGRQRNVAKLAEASRAAGEAAKLSRELNAAGALSVIDMLDIERQRLQSELALAQGQGELSNAFIALEKSLGLGWSPAPTPAVAPAVASAQVKAQVKAQAAATAAGRAAGAPAG